MEFHITGSRFKFSHILFIFLIVFSNSQAQQDNGITVRRETVERVEFHVHHLASPFFQGRSTLTGHDIKASVYIDSIFRSFVFQPNNGISSQSLFQPFSVIQTTPLRRSLTFKGIDYEYGKDFICLGPEPPSDKEFEIVFGGLDNSFGNELMEIKGKALLILSENLRTGGMKVQEQAEAMGCSMIMVINSKNPIQFENIAHMLNEQHSLTRFRIAETKASPINRFFSRFDNPLPQILISDSLAKIMLGMDPIQIWHSSKKKQQVAPLFKGIKVTFNFNYKYDTISTRNIISFLPSESGSQQSVVLCAHYDHLEPEGSTWYPGADDNASGIAVLIEVARLFYIDALRGYKPSRNIVFAAFSAEEIGLLGSQHYAYNPLFPVDSTVLLLNLDMVGRPFGEKEKKMNVCVSGSNMLSQFTNLVRNIYVDSTFDIHYRCHEEVSNFSMSDHQHYMEKGVPAYLLTTGMHTDYHEPSDTPEKLNYDGMFEIIRLTYQTIKHFADHPNPWEIRKN